MSEKSPEEVEMWSKMSAVVWSFLGPQTTWHPNGIRKDTGILTNFNVGSSGLGWWKEVLKLQHLGFLDFFHARKLPQFFGFWMAMSRLPRINASVYARTNAD